jgi:hypothetical protein
MIQERISKVTSGYNEVHKLTKKLELESIEAQKQSIVTTGVKNVFVNRYKGLVNVGGLYQPVVDGMKWGWYFCLCPTLQNDVRVAGSDWAKGLLYTSVQNFVKVTSTVVGTTPKDYDRIQDLAQQRVKRQLEVMTFSILAGAAISMTLKQVGMRAKQEYLRTTAKSLRFGWQVTGLIGIAYGFSEIAKMMEDTDKFGSYLKVHRDKYLSSDETDFENVSDLFIKHTDNSI